MNTPTRLELYNSQNTKTLENMRDRIIESWDVDSQVINVVDTINYVLSCRKNWEDVKECMWACDWSCKDKCINRK